MLWAARHALSREGRPSRSVRHEWPWCHRERMPRSSRARIGHSGGATRQLEARRVVRGVRQRPHGHARATLGRVAVQGRTATGCERARTRGTTSGFRVGCFSQCVGRWLGLTPERPALCLRGFPGRPRVALSRVSDPPGWVGVRKPWGRLGGDDTRNTLQSVPPRPRRVPVPTGTRTLQSARTQDTAHTRQHVCRLVFN